MNAAHILGKKKNRMKRCRKRLATGELGSAQRLALETRAAEIEAELFRAGKK